MLSRVLLAGTIALAALQVAADPEAHPLPSRALQGECPAVDPLAALAELTPRPPQDPELHRILERVERYEKLAENHRLEGLASYYSSFFDGRKTASGEVYRNRAISAAHLTLPLGTWIEVIARKSGKRVRMRVNDRGPYARKFMLDLSQAAARELGVHVGNREVEVRIIALPGESPLPDDYHIRVAEARNLAGAEVPEKELAAR